jgi:cytochrome c biogenesis protein CcdA
VTDPAGGVGILAAVAAGALSFLSPCVLPLVPGYLSTVVGVAPADLERAGGRRVLPPSVALVASFSVIFILLGLTATGVGSMLRAHHALFAKVAAAVIVALGLLFVASAFVDRLNRDWHVDALLRRAGRGGPVVSGAAFAIAWTPCVGPTLGAIRWRGAPRHGRPGLDGRAVSAQHRGPARPRQPGAQFLQLRLIQRLPDSGIACATHAPTASSPGT